MSGGSEEVYAAYDYNGVGQVQSLCYGNGVQTKYSYRDDGEMDSLVTVTEQGQVLLNFDYAYDGNGNCIRKSGKQYQNEYAYDCMNRLAGVVQDGQEEKYAYDLAGNRLKKESVQGTEIYYYNAKNQLTHIRNGESTLRYLYDKQGNLLEEQGNTKRKQYTYDAANRQVGIISAGADGTMGQLFQSNRYDGEGLRYETEENGKIIHFLFDRGELAEENREEGRISYVRGYNPISLRERNRKPEYFVQDEAGSTLFILGKEHEIQKTYRYDAFGNLLREEGDAPNRLTYTGQMYDGTACQYYLRARFYNPAIGRFMQEDTYRGDGLNLYAYCANNPVMYFDPSGFAQLCINAKTEPGANPTDNRDLQYQLSEWDMDWRGTNRTYRDAVDEAFAQIEAQTGYTRDQFVVTKWARDEYGKSIPVEYLGPDNSYVDIDYSHYGMDGDGNWASGPDAPHVGWQYGTNGKVVGHIILDSVPAGRDSCYSDLLKQILEQLRLTWPKKF